MTNATLVSSVDNEVGGLEQAIADALGFTVNSDITESPVLFDNAGRITKALLRQVAAGPVGHRFRDSTSGKEFRIVANGSNLDIDENTGTEAVPVWVNRTRLIGGVSSAGIKYASIAAETLVNPSSLTAFTKKYTIAANTLAVGSVIRARAYGIWTNAVLAALSMRLRIGGPSVMVNCPGFDKSASVRVWSIEGQAIVRSLGAVGIIGDCGWGQVGDNVIIPDDAPGSALNTTIDRDVECAVSIIPADAGNNIELVGFSVEVLRAETTS